MNINMEYQEVMGHDFFMKLPDQFQFMPEPIVQIKYPSENRPQVILTNDDYTVDFKFSYIEEEIDPDLLKDLMRQTKLNLGKIYTSIQYFEEEITTWEGIHLGWFEFTSAADGDTLYNIVFFTWVKGKLLNGAFHCRYEEAVTWRSNVLDSIRTIKEGDKQGE